MIEAVPPFLIFLAGALLIPFLNGNARRGLMLLVPVLAWIDLMGMGEGVIWEFDLLGHTLVLGRVDALSRVFGHIFIIMAFAGALFSLHVREAREQVAAFLYVGSALGAVFSGDLLSLFIFWEVMALSSVFLVWFRNTPAASDAGFRYLLVHLFGGVCLLTGIILFYARTGSLTFGLMTLDGLDTWLILVGFLLNAGAPPLHAWLPDAYPEATVSGTVFLSAFTTKTAVYVLARGFPGAEVLIWVGIIMTLYGIVYAILENDMRRILAYSIINQVGFMVAGIGIGTEMAMNGAVSHAFCHILYKALLLMSAGAVLYQTGKTKCTELGGLYKTMPLTMLFCVVGAASISAFPLFSGFVSKAMVLTAAEHEGMVVAWLLLTLASAGVFLHAGIKFPYFVFFAKDSGLRPPEPPRHMLWAMGLLAFLCVYLGIFPGLLYRILPYPVDFHPYTGEHVVGQLQLLMFSALAFFLLLKQLQRTPTLSLDTDWFYRKGTEAFLWLINQPGARFGRRAARLFFDQVPDALAWFSRNPLAAARIVSEEVMVRVYTLMGLKAKERLARQVAREEAIYPEDFIRHWPIGSTVLWVTAFLLTCLLIYILQG